MYRTELFWPDDSGMNLNIVETMDGVFREKEFLKKHRFLCHAAGRLQPGDTGRHRPELNKEEGQVRIDSGVMEMESSRTYRSYQMQSVKEVRVGIGSRGLSGGLAQSDEKLTDAEHQNKKKTQEKTEASDVAAHFRSLSNTGRVSTQEGRQADASFTIRQRCAQYLLEMIFGGRRRNLSEELQEVLRGNQSVPAVTLRGIEQEYYYREEECTTFSTSGIVRTADGREISFGLECSMSRSFEQYYREQYTLGTVSYLDPLVINLDTDVAQVSDQKFFFDLDCDGTQEEISLLKKGSGFLALDRNEDGVIGDGSELFGTASGDGFGDLAAYDEDANGWIDEADPIWEKLLIWTKDEEGQDKLYHLSDLGVGAICLSSAATEYALNAEQDNANLAMIRRTGIFLYENGMTSTVQHLDLAR